MFNKRYLIILLFLIMAIGAISQVSASDVDAVDEISAGDASIEGLSSEEIVENEVIGADLNNEEIISENSSSQIPQEDTSGNNESVVPQEPKKVKINAAKLTAIYKSKKQFKVKVLDSNNKAVSGLNLKIKVYTGSKFKTYSVTTNSKGMASIKVSGLKLGKHKVLINTNNDDYAGTASSLIKINPRPVTIKVATIKNKQYSAVYAAVKDKTLKKYVNGIKVKILVYTGKKYKTYKVATSYLKDAKQNGAIMYLTNALSVGKHKVKLVAYGNYKGTKTSRIILLKSAKKYVPTYAYSKKGKMVVYVKYKGQWFRA